MEAWSCDIPPPSTSAGFPELGATRWPVLQVSAHYEVPWGFATVLASTAVPPVPPPQFLTGA